MKSGCLFASIILLAACGDGSGGSPLSDPTTVAVPDTVPAGEIIDLGAYDLPLFVTVPDAQTALADSVGLRWNEERGWLEVNRGAHFDLRISEQPADLGRLKADLERDPLHKNTVIAEAPDRIIYRQEFPADASLVFVHFLMAVRVGDREFTVESAPDGRFNESDVRRMASAVTSSDPA